MTYLYAANNLEYYFERDPTLLDPILPIFSVSLPSVTATNDFVKGLGEDLIYKLVGVPDIPLVDAVESLVSIFSAIDVFSFEQIKNIPSIYI